MSVTIWSSRVFNQNAGGAKRAAEQGPVVITDRGKPSHVLLTFAEYQRLAGRGSILDRLAMPEAAAIDFEPDKAAVEARVPDLT